MRERLLRSGGAGRILIACIGGLLLNVAIPPSAQAHWCSNIYNTFARLVVKPERDQVNIPDGQSGQLKVRVRNQFPYSLRWIKLRTDEPAGLTVTVSPTESEAEQNTVVAGQEVTFTLTITRSGGSDYAVSDLNLEVHADVEAWDTGWQGSNDRHVDQEPNPDDVRNTNHQQHYGLDYSKLAELSCGNCEQEGVSTLMQMWNEETDGCEGSEFNSQWPQETIRAAQGLAIRLRYRTFSDPPRSDVVDVMLEAMDYNYEVIRGYAAFLTAYGGNDPGVFSRIESMATSDPDPDGCGFSSSSRAQAMAKAALLILGESQYESDVQTCVANNGGSGEAQMRTGGVCAAALGIIGQDDPITDFLIPRSGDGGNTSYSRLMNAYLLQLVVFARRGGPEGTGTVSFLPEDVVTDDVDPRAPTNFVVTPAS